MSFPFLHSTLKNRTFNNLAKIQDWGMASFSDDYFFSDSPLVTTCENSSGFDSGNTQHIDFIDDLIKTFDYDSFIQEAREKVKPVEPPKSMRKRFPVVSASDFSALISVKKSKFEKIEKKELSVDEIVSDKLSLRSTMANLNPQYRVSKCGRVVQRDSNHVGVFLNNETQKAVFSGLQSCGSVWHCPVCAAKITEFRRQEVLFAIEKHIAAGGSVSFVTRTAPHSHEDSLLDIRNKFRKAESKLKNHWSYRSLLKRSKAVSSIKVYELTVGEVNGWHFHVHEIYFHEAGAFEGSADTFTNSEYANFLEDFRKDMYSRWAIAATSSGFNLPSVEHGLQVQNGDFAAEYIAKWGCEPKSKWGVDAEMTKTHIKKAKQGLSPFELIRAYRETKDKALIPIIKEYANAMHGQRQLIWSRGAKKRFGINQLKDSYILSDDYQLKESEPEPEPVELKQSDLFPETKLKIEQLGVLSTKQWTYICKNGHQIETHLKARQGWQVLADFLIVLPDFPRFDDVTPLSSAVFNVKDSFPYNYI